jgi:coatomer protein complex subunit gamma
MVVYEAARAMVNLKNVTAREVQPAVSGIYMCVMIPHNYVKHLYKKNTLRIYPLYLHSSPVLQMFLTSAKPTIRFAAVKTLNRIAMVHPDAVTSCNVDLENLISDSNRSIATLAITTLLKVGRQGVVGIN